MTDVELLPLPEADGFMETFDTYGCPAGSEDAWGEETVKETIRANVAHAVAAKDAEIEALRGVLGRILENEASDYKVAEAFGGYVLDDELREEARAALEQEDK